MGTPSGPSGPFSASEMSQQLADGRLDWRTEVWREGLTSFRPARRDELLVLAVASARGLAGATMRLDSVQSLLNSSDTQVEVLSRGSLPGQPRRGAGGTLWVALFAFLAGAVVAVGPGRLAELARALPQGLRVQVSRSTPVAVGAPAPPFELAPATPVPPQSPAPGAALSASASASVQLVRAAPVVLGSPASLHVARAQGPASTRPKLPAEQVHAELERLGPPLLRCLSAGRRALELTLTLDGSSGRVRNLHVSPPALRPGALECVNEAFVDFQVSPFAQPTQRIKHRYAW